MNIHNHLVLKGHAVFSSLTDVNNKCVNGYMLTFIFSILYYKIKSALKIQS